MRLTLVFAMAVVAAGCNSTTNPTSDANRTTETFAGNLGPGGVGAHNFAVNGSGNVDIVLAALSPQTSITVGLGIGQSMTAGCSLDSYDETIRVGGGLSGALDPGAYCVEIYDLGNVQGSDTYTLTVTHP